MHVRPRYPFDFSPVPPEPTRLTLGTLLDRIDAGGFTVTRSAYGPRQTLPRHAHELASATVVLRGSVIERVASRRYELSDTRLLVRPAAVPHSNVYGDAGAECVIIGARADWIEHDAVAKAVFVAPRMATAPAPLAVARRIRRELALGDDAAALAVEGLVLELVATLARVLREPHAMVPRWLVAVREQLHERFATPLTLRALARDAGVHPVHLTRAFRRAYGVTPGDYVRQRRLDRACDQLAHSAKPVAEVALEAGFSSPSHFATFFRRTVGLSPSVYRASARTRA
jgi:AraC family transcriptional regulator